MSKAEGEYKHFVPQARYLGAEGARNVVGTVYSEKWKDIPILKNVSLGVPTIRSTFGLGHLDFHAAKAIQYWFLAEAGFWQFETRLLRFVFKWEYTDDEDVDISHRSSDCSMAYHPKTEVEGNKA